MQTNEQMKALSKMKEIADEAGISLCVTMTEKDNEVVAVSWQNEDYQILQLLWEKK